MSKRSVRECLEGDDGRHGKHRGFGGNMWCGNDGFRNREMEFGEETSQGEKCFYFGKGRKGVGHQGLSRWTKWRVGETRTWSWESFTVAAIEQKAEIGRGSCR